MKFSFTDSNCKICGKHKKHADHSECSRKLQERHNVEKKKRSRTAGKNVYLSGKSGDYFSKFF